MDLNIKKITNGYIVTKSGHPMFRGKPDEWYLQSHDDVANYVKEQLWQLDNQ